MDTTRYHALDSMRAAMMLLGIYLHVVVGYTGDGNWPYIDKNPTHLPAFTLGIIHAFRMPAFFAMAGFFGALLWNRRGPREFLRNRINRVLWPFAVFWSAMFPPVGYLVLSGEPGWPGLSESLRSGLWWNRLHPLHLWFLEYLLLLYALGALAARFTPARISDALHRAHRWALQRPWAPILFAAFSWAPLSGMHGNLKDCEGFAPEPLILAAYIPPFTFGWLLYRNRDLLTTFQRLPWVHLALAIPAYFIYREVPWREFPILRAAGNVLLCWFLIFGLLGLFLRHASALSPRWRYWSDSSYWLYIMHLPVVVSLQFALASVPLSALAKIPLVLALAVGILIATYDLFVRPTAIGALLNGRRYPRGLPSLEPAPSER